MTNAAEQPKLDIDDYLAGEETATIKHEYVAGEVFAMAGAGEAYVTVVLNLASLLRNHVRGGPCRVYIADMKVRVEQADVFYYPDLFVTCDPADGAGEAFQTQPDPGGRGPVRLHRRLRPRDQVRPLPTARFAAGVCAH